MFFLLLIHLAYGQNEVIGLKQYKISFVLPSDWIIIQEIPNPANNNLYFLRIKTLRNNSYHDYINVVIRIDNCKTEFLKQYSVFDCSLGALSLFINRYCWIPGIGEQSLMYCQNLPLWN